MYQKSTRNISVTVKPTFLDDRSSPADNYYLWAYQVKIENQGPETVQLRTRYWRITDAMGRIQEVRGPGVVGEQPILQTGQAFEYTSATPLSTPSGIMMGSYEMEKLDGGGGETFNVTIPAFSLDSPHEAVRFN